MRGQIAVAATLVLVVIGLGAVVMLPFSDEPGSPSPLVQSKTKSLDVYYMTDPGPPPQWADIGDFDMTLKKYTGGNYDGYIEISVNATFEVTDDDYSTDGDSAPELISTDFSGWDASKPLMEDKDEDYPASLGAMKGSTSNPETSWVLNVTPGTGKDWDDIWADPDSDTATWTLIYFNESMGSGCEDTYLELDLR